MEFHPEITPHTRGALRTAMGPGTNPRDHPRIRGEHEQRAADCRVPSGIIPAYAGSTPLQGGGGVRVEGSSPHTRGAPNLAPRFTTSRRDHPRIRGEHDPFPASVGFLPGIIPAYAGSTVPSGFVTRMKTGSSPHARGAPSAPSSGWSRGGDHPRIRGEHRSSRGRTWPPCRIIPAYAGSTGALW